MVNSPAHLAGHKASVDEQGCKQIAGTRRLLTHLKTPASSNEKVVRALSIALLLAVVVSESIWLELDTRLQPVIDEWVEKSLNLADGLSVASLWEAWRHIYWASLGPRLPLYPVLAVPPLWLFDRSVDSILVVNRASLALLAFATYRLASRILDYRAGFLAAALVLLYPLSTMLVKLARPHSLLPSTVAFALLALYTLAFDAPRAKSVWLASFAILVVFGAHAAGLHTLFVASALAGLLLLRNMYRETTEWRPRQDGAISKMRHMLRGRVFFLGVLPSIVLIPVIILGWLAVKREQYRGLMGILPAFETGYSEWHYEATIASALGIPSLVLLGLGVGTLLFECTRVRTNVRNGTAFVGLSILGALAVAHAQPGAKSWQTFAGILPMLAVLSAVGAVLFLDRVKSLFKEEKARRMTVVAGMSTMTAAAALTYIMVNWGRPSDPPIIGTLTGVQPTCIVDGGACMNPPVGGDWFAREVVSAVISDARCPSKVCVVSVLGHRQKYFSDEALTYSLVIEHPAESRIQDGGFYPARNVVFRRVAGTLEDARAQISGSDFVLLLEGNRYEPARSGNEFVENETLLNSEVLKATLPPSATSAVVLSRLLPTGERLMLVARK